MAIRKVPALATKMREHRLCRNWPQVQVADRMGIADANLRKWELGKRVPSVQSLKSWAIALSLTPREIGEIVMLAGIEE